MHQSPIICKMPLAERSFRGDQLQDEVYTISKHSNKESESEIQCEEGHIPIGIVWCTYRFETHLQT